jgi:retrotransposon gag protein
MNQNNLQQSHQAPQDPPAEPERPSMNPSEISGALLALMNELTLLRNEIKAQEERSQQDLATLRAEMLNTPRPLTPGTPNPDLPVPPVPSSTPPIPPMTTTSTPLVQPSKSERLPDPEKFTGKRNELRPFLAQLRNKLEGNADRYPSDRERLRYALSRLAGDAAIMVETFNPSSLAGLIENLEISYGDPNRQATAQQKLNRMAQGDQSFPTYFAKFHQYSKETGWNDAAQINHLVESLNPELKRTLVGVTLPQRLGDCANLINRHYNDLMRLQPRPTQSRSAPKTTPTLTSTAARPSTRPPTQANKKDPDAMELDPGTQGYAPKNSAERQKRIKEGRCFKCGSKTHLSPDCSVPIPRTISMEIASPRIDSRPSSSGGMSLNEPPRE